jgi:hypothetical protein
MSRKKLATWVTLAATVSGLFYFRGDIQRYVKMKMM